MEKKIWDNLLKKIKNPIGVGALMGNLYVESKLNPRDLQGSYARKFGMTDDEYTNAVDNGSYSRDKFIHDSAGYGLVQWTFWSRKQSLYDYAKSVNASIGDLNMQLDFLWDEISNHYKTVAESLKNAVNLRESSDVVVKRYEKPLHQEEKYLQNRANYGQQFYDKYANEPTVMVIATDNVNIRVGNGYEYNMIGILDKGSCLPYVTTVDKWYAVKYKQQVCWVSGEFSQLSSQV